MRDPYVELGLAIVGQAIRDWRLESKALEYRTDDTPFLRKIEKFLNGELADACLGLVEIDPKVVLQNLRYENATERWKRAGGNL